MALTAIEQLRVIAGEAKPEGTDLLSLVLQTGVIHGITFKNALKDTSADADAEAYKNKFLGVTSKLFAENIPTATHLRRLIIVILGGNSVTFQQVVNATDAQWAGFVLDKMDEAIEFLAGITAAEKTAYLAL